MAKDFESLKQQALVIKNEVEDGANSSERVGVMLEDIVESMKLGTCEFNVSSFYPTSGISGGNKYTLETAIAQVPAELRSSVNTVSFLNQAGKTEKWEFGGGSWATGSFTQIGAGALDKQGVYNVDANVPLNSGFYTSTTARNAVPSSVRKLGLIITYKTDATTSVTEQFIGSDVSGWATDTNWKNVGSEGGNKILEWNTDVATTRKQVPQKERKAGMQISYTSDGENWTNEQFIGTTTDDTSWSDDNNWKLLPNKSQIEEVYGKYGNENEYLLYYTDNEGRILFGIKSDGSIEWSKGIPTPIQDALNKIKDFIYCQNISYDMYEMTVDNDNRILSFRDEIGIKHEEKLDANVFYHKGKEIRNVADTSDIPSASDIPISELDGVQYHQLDNLFDKNDIKAYDSDFADKVYSVIGRKTDDTGCYSNLIECKEGDWFTRSDFGTGIVVVLNKSGEILGDVANAAYSPTIQITPSKKEYDFSEANYVSFVVPLANLEDERIVKAKYMPVGEGNFLTIPKLRVKSDNVDKDMVSYIKSTSGRYYSLKIDDSGDSPTITPILLEGIPMSDLPEDFPLYSVKGDFSEYYESIVLCPIEGGVVPYLYELSSEGLVKRYLKAKVNCPRIIHEDGEWYFYGVDGSLNSSSGKLNIYKRDGETFKLVVGNLGDGSGGYIEPHDCFVISVNPVHYICQKWVSNIKVQNSSGEPITIMAVHIEEIFNGKSVWEWHSEDYPELLEDSNYSGGDYLHNNTICLDSDGNLCLNNRSANQILVIERTWDNESHTGTIGDILWKIGGNRHKDGWDVPTRIKTTEEQQWSECHDTVVDGNGLWTLFNNKTGTTNPSEIIEFKIDTNLKNLTNYIKRTWKSYKGQFMGSVDKAKDGVYLVSWGSSRSAGTTNAGVYDFNNNKAVFEITFNNTGSSVYRVYGIPKNV